VIKGFTNNASASSIIKHLSKNKSYKAAITNFIAKSIRDEVNTVVKRRETLLKVTDVDDLLNFDWLKTESELKDKLPVFMTVLQCFREKKSQKAVAKIVTAASILIYTRNQNINLLQRLLGTVLDGCGLTKEVFYGLSVFILKFDDYPVN